MEERSSKGLHLVCPGVGPHRQSELFRRDVPVPGALLGDGSHVCGVGEEILDDSEDGGPELVVVVSGAVLPGRVQELIQDGADPAEGSGVFGVCEPPE